MTTSRPAKINPFATKKVISPAHDHQFEADPETNIMTPKPNLPDNALNLTYSIVKKTEADHPLIYASRINGGQSVQVSCNVPKELHDEIKKHIPPSEQKDKVSFYYIMALARFGLDEIKRQGISIHATRI